METNKEKRAGLKSTELVDWEAKFVGPKNIENGEYGISYIHLVPWLNIVLVGQYFIGYWYGQTIDVLVFDLQNFKRKCNQYIISYILML